MIEFYTNAGDTFHIKPNTQYVIDWIGRMTRKYGGAVYEKKRGTWWDWGQALCREQYGEDWNDIVPPDPTIDDVIRASAWEKGDFPDWVDLERMNIIFGEER
jgi:hypothetical protein